MTQVLATTKSGRIAQIDRSIAQINARIVSTPGTHPFFATMVAQVENLKAERLALTR